MQDFLVEDRPISPVGDHLTGSLAEPKATSLSAPGRAHSLEGESPLHTRQGEMLAEQQRRHREVGSGGSCEQSAGLTNRKRIEATHWGEVAQITKAQYLHGTMRRKSDRHKRD